MRPYHHQLFWLTFSIVLLVASVALLALRSFEYDMWEHYYFAYLIVALAHTAFVFVLLGWGDLRPRKYRRYAGEHIVVVMPCYNEELALFEQSVRSILGAEGSKKLVVVDDGSTNGIEKVLPALARELGFTLHTQPKNLGKRRALFTAFERYVADSDVVVLVDSDTVVARNALIRIAEPVLEARIGAASGDVRVLNERQNLLTRMAGAYYWSALNLERKAQSTLGMVACCSGALAAYKGRIVRSISEEFLHEMFLGQRCVSSDDRHLTNLVMREGYDVVYVDKAVAYTHSPTTYRAFLRQQLRWRRGFFQEAFFALTHLWKRKPLLCLSILIWDMCLLFLSFGLVILILLNSLVDPVFLLVGILPALATLAVIRQLPLLLKEPRKLFPLLAFSFFAHFVMFWQSVYAILTLKKSVWLTR